ncbi:hypothetical protein R5M92_12120 [Halomonas sp. Bachu 37]
MAFCPDAATRLLMQVKNPLQILAQLSFKLNTSKGEEASHDV